MFSYDRLSIAELKGNISLQVSEKESLLSQIAELNNVMAAKSIENAKQIQSLADQVIEAMCVPIK